MARQSNKLGLKISLPQNIQPEQTTQAPKKETVFETDKFGALTITNILPADGSRATVETDRGTFYFYTTDYINKGKESGGKQFYSKAFIHPELRQQVDENSVAVNIQDAPNSIFTTKERTTLSNETGILIPKDVANETIQRYTSIHDIDKNGRITGISNGRYLLDNSGSEKTTYIFTETNPAANAQYFTPSEGGMFKSIFGNNILGNALQGVSDTLANVEDIGREGIEGVDAALQNKYVRAVTKAVAALSPDPITRSIAIAVDSYQTLDSGENLSPSQIVAIAGAGAQLSGVGTSGAEAGLEDLGFSTDINPNAFAVDASGAIVNTPTLTGVPGTVFDDVSFRLANSAAKISEGGDVKDILLSEFGGDLNAIDPEAFKAVNAGVRIAKGEDAGLVLLETYGEDVASELGLKSAAEGAIVDNFGEDALQTLKDNKKIAQVGADILIGGKDPSEAVASRFADDIVELSGASTTNQEALVKAGLDTAVALDQGANTDEALLKGAETYVDEGGSVDLNIDADLLGNLSFEGEGVDFGGVGDILTSVGNTIADAAGPIKAILTEAGDIIAEGAAPIKEGVIAAGDVLADVGTAAGNVIANAAEPLKNTVIELGDVINEGGAILDDVVSENLPEVDINIPELDLPEVAINLPEVDINIPEVEFPEVEFPEVEGPDIDIQKPTLDLLDFSGLLGGLSLGLSSSGEKGTTPAGNIGGSAYQTQFDFLRNVEPLGTIGMFGRNKA
jgi:hypothetical protein